jgi:hypothetical protein
MKIIFAPTLLYKVYTFVVQETLLYLISMNDRSHTKCECIQKNIYIQILLRYNTFTTFIQFLYNFNDFF